MPMLIADSIQSGHMKASLRRYCYPRVLRTVALVHYRDIFIRCIEESRRSEPVPDLCQLE